MQRITTLLAYLFLCVSCLPQQYPFVHYTPKDGLVNSRVRKTYQDSKGRMYFLTYGGLSVYDGARFRNYSSQNGLANEIVNDVLEVGDDSVLIASNVGVLTAWVRGRIVMVKTEGVPCPIINQFYRAGPRTIYLACDDGLFLLENKKIRELNISRLFETSREPAYFDKIIGKANYLVLTSHELRQKRALYLYDIKNNRICDILPDHDFFLLGKDNKERVWLSISGKPFILDSIALLNGRIQLIPPTGNYSALRDYSTLNMCFDKNSIWTVFRKNLKNQDIRHIEESGSIHTTPLPEQAIASDIKNIFIDSENNIWLSNDGEGVFKIVKSPLQILTAPFSETRSYINAVSYFGERTWFRTNRNKLLLETAGGLQQIYCNLKESPIIIYEDKRKLLARDHNGIYEAALTTNQPLYFQKIITLANNDFFPGAVIVDRNEFIIASQLTGLAIWKNNEKVLHLPLDKNDIVQEIAFDKNNLLWVTRRYHGIEVFSLHPQTPSKYLSLVKSFPQSGLTGSSRSFVLDKNGLIWIGTRNDGLVAYQEVGNELKKKFQFNTGTGLSDNFVKTLACDSANNIIVGTQTGLDRILFNEDGSYRVENLSKSSNFFAVIVQTWADKEQAYALTTSNVLLKISTKKNPGTDHTPSLLLEEIRVNAQVASPAQQHFNHKENNISFLVAAPSFIDEKQVTYSYLLEGSGNNHWSDTSTTNAVINLTNLSAGKYILKVKAFFPSALYTPVELSRSFEIRPPWWQTWWSKSLGGLIIAGFLFTSIRFYYRRRMDKQMATLEKQQAIEKERTRIATDMHDDLGAGLSRIKFLSQSIKKNLKDETVKTDLEKITSFSDEMSEKMGEIIWALNEKNDTVADLVAYTRSYAAEYLGNHDIICEASTPLDLPASFIPGEMRRNIFLSVKECLHNIVKHAEASKVKFSIVLNGDLQIVIHDNGKGIDWENRRSFSNGMQNITRRMKEMNGDVNFSNENGAKVCLTIPVTL
jgi:signal transduction histidine kinase/ligand-binding sensor domain-containing protein